MPATKLKASGTTDVMKTEAANDSVDTFIRQAIGKEPLLSFSRAGDSPVQWIQLLHALDQQEIPGWPLLSPVKVQMQKCDKCSREFCSTINYRRHIRLHRRSLNLDKDSTTKNRDYLQAFWDMLSIDEAMEILSFKDVTLEDVTGSSIIKALSSSIRKPGFSSLPHAYVRAGSALMDIVQGKPSGFFFTAQELFSILDDASEKTFLCAGTAESVQKFVFNGEAGKIGLEMRNLVACTSFLIEQKLVKAWLADKDAKALRCQKLLVEEEEAAQKRQAAILERKRQKKLRQKEQKMKEQTNGEQADFLDDVASTTDGVPSPPIPSPLNSSDSDAQNIPQILQDPIPSYDDHNHDNEEEDVIKAPQSSVNDIGYPDSGTYQNIEHRSLHTSGRRHSVNSRWQAPKLQRGHQGVKFASTQKHATYRDSRAGVVANVGKVWTPKPKSETDEDCKVRLQNEPTNPQFQNVNSEVLIGSISVTLGDQSSHQLGGNHGGAADSCAAVPLPLLPKHGIEEKPANGDTLKRGVNPLTVKLCRPVSQHANGGSLVCQNGFVDVKVDEFSCKGSGDFLQICLADGNDGCCGNNLNSSGEEGGHLVGGLRFSSRAAAAFLAQRWKEAMAADHVELVLFPETEPPELLDNQDDCEAALSSQLNNHSILSNRENCRASFGALGSSASPKSKLRTKSDKGSEVQYILKPRCPA
ncbi:hypothetical protein Nepgr_021489 [Nepenthes gracilis]|uniref:C2H2-type domain-containing protein n=1 Tax=Nepenthes gracilis TaxID=150966 RepID=A0AAD3XW44_NEPGR|nr:hypothetical protein Nepgr_021489 [Nepenthes gracilis]